MSDLEQFGAAETEPWYPWGSASRMPAVTGVWLISQRAGGIKDAEAENNRLKEELASVKHQAIISKEALELAITVAIERGLAAASSEQLDGKG